MLLVALVRVVVDCDIHSVGGKFVFNRVQEICTSSLWGIT